MKCTSCGTEIETNAKFCRNCGKSIDNAAPSAPAQPANPTPTQPNQVQQPAPVATYVNNGQPQKKKGNTALIIVLVILGVFIVGGIIIAFVIKSVFSNIVKEIENYEPDISDVTNSSGKPEGEVVKTAKDPLGHEIKIVADDIYIYKVDLEYLRDKETDMKKNAKAKTIEEIEKSNATSAQKGAMKRIVKKLNDYAFNSRPEIVEALKNDNYSDEVINYAMENCGVDWDEQASIAAVNILAAGGFSEKELSDLMEYENFTEKEIKYALASQKFDYYEQAVYDTCFYKYTSKNYGGAYSREDAQSLLEYAGYSKDEVEFALKLVYDEME